MAPGNGQYCSDRDVLVIEDDPEINQLIGAYVEFAGFRYLSALDGAQALHQLRQHLPRAIILDLMLPDVSGWEVCKRLKCDLDSRHIPIIILTALDTDDSRREGIRCGAAEYLTKPFNPDEFLELLKKHVEQNRPAEVKERSSS